MKHHYIPCFYLQRWAKNKNQVICWTRKNNKLCVDSHPPKNTGFEIDLYKRKGVDESASQSHEIEHYKKVDDKASKIFNKLVDQSVSANKLTPQEKVDFCIFIFSILTRHPDRVDFAKRASISILNDIIPNIPNEFRDAHAQQLEILIENFSIDAIALMSNINSKNHNENIKMFISSLMMLNWRIINFDTASLDLITCDIPINIVPFNNTHSNGRNSVDESISEKLTKSNYMMVFPLSPKKCFLAYKFDLLNLIRENNKVIKAINKFTANISNKLIYSTDKTHIDLIKKHLK